MVIGVKDLGGQDKDTSASSISPDAEQAVIYWQSINNVQLPPIHKKIAIEAYNTQYREKRGIIRQDLVDMLGYSPNYAKKILSECIKCKLLVHLDGHKQGRFHECFLSTEIDTFLQKQADKKNQGKTIESSSISVIQMLINEITDKKPTFHKLMIHVRMGCCDNAGVEFDQDYMLLLREFGWIIKSQKNKAKVKSFKLEHKRSCTIQVYPKGKVIVMIKCSSRPFKLHEDDGSGEFFETIGAVKRILSQQFRQHSIIPPTGEWLVKEYDRDVTIPESDLVKKYPQISHWYSKEGIQLRALGRVFQIYGKIMPICGKCLRFEDKVGIKEDIPLEQGIEQAIERPLEIITAFEMHERTKRNESIN